MKVSVRKLFSDFVHRPVEQIVHDWGTPPLFLKRLDLIQSWASGNKFYKLKYNIGKALDEGIHSIVSKGGMFSNHLEALAKACDHFEIKCICMVRSYGLDENNPTIQKLRSYKAEVKCLEPDAYNAFDNNQASALYPGSLFIPEGGSDENGIRGAAEIWEELEIHHPTHIVLPGGTMSTAAGLISASTSNVQIIIVPAWKGCTREYTESLLTHYEIKEKSNWDIWPDFHFGGFARYNHDLVEFMTTFSKKYGIPLDPVYTGKMMFGIREKILSGYFPVDAKIIAIHTGGLQGIEGFAYRDSEVWGKYVELISPFYP